MSKVPSKVHVIGGPGSGKTTLAQQLAELVAAPTYDLDKVAYHNGVGAKQPSVVRNEEVQAILEQPTWVTEGIYLWWTEPLFEAASVIVWLDLPWPVAVWRIVVRHLKRSWAGNNPHPGLLRLWRFVRWQVEHYYRRPAVQPASPDDDSTITRAATAHALAAHTDKVVRLRSAGAVATFLNTYSSPAEVATAEAVGEGGNQV